MRIALLIACVVAMSAPARAEKIAVIDSDKLYDTGGIARWLVARAKLDEERKKFKVAESPDGKAPEKPMDCTGSKDYVEMCRRLNQMKSDRRESEVWTAHERSVLEPIEAEVTSAIKAFAKARRIDLLLETSEDMLYISPAIDITSAFIKDFNAKPAPRPAPLRR